MTLVFFVFAPQRYLLRGCYPSDQEGGKKLLSQKKKINKK
jgi:hypothetical protein